MKPATLTTWRTDFQPCPERQATHNSVMHPEGLQNELIPVPASKRASDIGKCGKRHRKDRQFIQKGFKVIRSVE